MIRKFLKTNICIIAMLCVFCSSVTAFAVDGDLDFDFNIQPEVPTTQAETIPVETEKETEKATEKETEKQTEKQTEKETTEKPTKKPDKKPSVPQTTKKENKEPGNVSGGNENVNVQVNSPTTQKEPTTEETTDETLKKGEFYVYLERNNGQRRLKTILKKKDYVPEPSEPVREGYIFSGWYADSKFKKPWNFMTDKADKQMTIYAKWTAIGDIAVYDIIIKDTVGGALEVNPQKASMGEPVVITVVPDEGKRLVQGSIRINGEATDFLTFVMPEGKVTITAEFEDIPEDAGLQEKSKLPLFIAMGVVFVIIIILVVVLTKKRRDFNADLDPDEDIFAIDEEEDDDNWIDESIIVEDGFVEGKKVVESTEPDYGAPDLDEDE